MSYVRHDKNNSSEDPQPGSTDASDLGGSSGWTEVSYKNFNADYEAHNYLNADRTPGTFQARNFNNNSRTPGAHLRHDVNCNPEGKILIITYGITSPGGEFNLRSTDTVDYEVEWGDGDVDISTANTLPHTYAAGDYTADVYSSDVYRPYFNLNTADSSQITSVVIGPGANLGNSLQHSWSSASNITSFVCPFDVTSSVTNFTSAWRDCSGLTSFPLIDISGASGEYSFLVVWMNCTGLTSFPRLDFSSVTRLLGAWWNCSNLTDFPDGRFDTTGTLSSDAFNIAWAGCALTAQSIENILVSLDTNGQSNIQLSIQGGTNAAKTTWSAAANTAYNNLITKGWTISYNA